jgi:hypothetical protein
MEKKIKNVVEERERSVCGLLFSLMQVMGGFCLYKEILKEERKYGIIGYRTC